MKTISVESQQDSLEIEFVLSWEDREKAETIYRATLRAKQGRGVYRPALYAVSTALIAASMTPVWPTMSGLAKLQIM